MSTAHHVADQIYKNLKVSDTVSKINKNNYELTAAHNNVIVPTLGNQIINDSVKKFLHEENFDLDAIYEHALKVVNGVLTVQPKIPSEATPKVLYQPTQEKQPYKREESLSPSQRKLSISGSDTESTDL